MLLVPVLAASCYYRIETDGENLSKADVIVVPGYALKDNAEPSWILHNRVLMAKILWDRGYAPMILMSGGKPESGITESVKMAELAQKFGVPQEQIVLETRAVSSIENGRYTAEIMKRRGWTSGLVVSDAQHLLYAIPVFRDAFTDNGLALYWTPVDYDLLKTHPDRHEPPE
ncbi:MAG: YdcF family protein [Planctomycetota bacterium]|jgi:uncharacterized SAM-binding protein YcdF (DUF218 family)